MNLSKNWADRISAQPMFDILETAAIKESQGNYIARMEIGDTPGFRNIVMNEILKKFSGEPHRYSPSKGEPLLIDILFEKQWKNFSKEDFGISIAPANFLIMASLAAIASPGDTILIPDPGFPTYKLACDFLGLKTIRYSLYPSESCLFPAIPFTKNIDGTFPKAIIINNPSNPLGLAYEGKQVLTAIRSLTENNVKIIIDETYINLVYDATQALIPSLDAIRIRTFSKEHCAPGLRIGYVLANHEISQVISDFISLTISCVPRFIQMAIAEYLSGNESGEFLESVISEMKSRHSLLINLLPRQAILAKPNSTFYAMVETGDSRKSFDFFMQKNVSTCPGIRFGPSAGSALRISIAGSSENLSKDFEMLLRAYEDWQSAAFGNPLI